MPNIDRNHLLSLAYSRTTSGRTALAEAIMDLFAGKTSFLTDLERSLMFDILHKIILDVEMAVRKALSAKLAAMPDAPIALIKQLANDHVEVAYEVLTKSRVLHDEDLIEVIRFRTLEHQLAIAMRYSVSEVVSATLAETGSESVIEALLRNENARISQGTLAYLVEQSRRMDTFQEPLLSRKELTPELAKRMFLWVSAALRSHIISQFQLDDASVDALLEQTALEQSEKIKVAVDADTDSEKLACEMETHRMLEPQLLVKAMAQGEINLFVGMFAQAARLRTRLVKRILFEPGGDGLAIACRGIGLDDKTFAQIFTLSRAARPHCGDIKAEMERATAVFRRLSQTQAERFLHRWRLDPDYAAALHALESNSSHG
jgi:uncharacterized protein (DUF2336 family)